MNRAFRVPILPALQGAARARFSSATTTQSNNQGNPLQPLATNGGEVTPQSFHYGNTPTKAVNDKMRTELLRIKARLERNVSVKEVQNLVQVHAMMKIYRRYRDEAGHVNASEPLHAILTILRVRSRVLKPVISSVRKQIMGSQNEVLSNYLNEITDDLIAGRSYASHFALTYLLTAFSTMEEHAQASAVWKRLNGPSSSDAAPDSISSLTEKLRDPRVVSAALRTSDPSVVSLEDFEKTYKETTERHGRYLLADEALAMGYLRFKEYDNAVKMYTSMCDYYDIAKWEVSLVRLHNNILTECTNIDIANVFFETALAEESFVHIHPAAAAKYLVHLYDGTGDIKRVVDSYERATARLKTQTRDYGVQNRGILISECVKCIVQREFSLTGPTEEAKALLDRVFRDENQLVLNTGLSYVAKSWSSPEYIAQLQQRFPPVAELEFDAVRILLNTSQGLSIEQCSLDRVAELWKRLCELKPPRLFDWLSLAKACDNADRATYLVEQFKEMKPTSNEANGLATRLDKAPIAKAALVAASLLPESGPETAYTTTEVEGEINARNVK